MGRIAAFIFVVLILTGGYFFLQSKKDIDSKSDGVFGSTTKEVKHFPDNNWFPKIDDPKANRNINDIYLSAKSAILVNFDTGDVLYAKNVNDRLPVASTIKIMTALVALENANINDSFTVSAYAASVGENSMGLDEGERLTLNELLYGMMLVSGNDAALTIAEGIQANEHDFVNLMNERVKSLGLNNTIFVNTSGLDEDGKLQYSSAYDLATISHYIWGNYAIFRTIASTDRKFIEGTQRHKAFDLFNDTNLLTTYPGVRGIKPGFTWEAGWCLVTYAQNENKRLIGVVLGSEDRRGEMIELLDYGFAKYGIHIEHPGLDL
mgnify:CR=1 FL=1